MAPVWAHRAVIFAIAQLSCFVFAYSHGNLSLSVRAVERIKL